MVTLKQAQDYRGYQNVKELLDMHFSGISRFTRFIMKSVVPFIRYYGNADHHNYFRVNILLGKRLRFLKARIDKPQFGQGMVPKISKSYAYLVPSSKSVFQSNRTEDPAFDLLRQRIAKEPSTSSRKSSTAGFSY